MFCVRICSSVHWPLDYTPDDLSQPTDTALNVPNFGVRKSSSPGKEEEEERQQRRQQVQPSKP